MSQQRVKPTERCRRRYREALPPASDRAAACMLAGARELPDLMIASRCVSGVVLDCQCPPACALHCDLIWTDSAPVMLVRGLDRSRPLLTREVSYARVGFEGTGGTGHAICRTYTTQVTGDRRLWTKQTGRLVGHRRSFPSAGYTLRKTCPSG